MNEKTRKLMEKVILEKVISILEKDGSKNCKMAIAFITILAREYDETNKLLEDLMDDYRNLINRI